jgi:hypothetical protein
MDNYLGWVYLGGWYEKGRQAITVVNLQSRKRNSLMVEHLLLKWYNLNLKGCFCNCSSQYIAGIYRCGDMAFNHWANLLKVKCSTLYIILPHTSFVFAPAVKAVNNIVVVWCKYYVHILKVEIVNLSTFWNTPIS